MIKRLLWNKLSDFSLETHCFFGFQVLSVQNAVSILVTELKCFFNWGYSSTYFFGRNNLFNFECLISLYITWICFNTFETLKNHKWIGLHIIEETRLYKTTDSDENWSSVKSKYLENTKQERYRKNHQNNLCLLVLAMYNVYNKFVRKNWALHLDFWYCSLFHKVYYLLDSILLIDLDRDSKVTQRDKK